MLVISATKFIKGAVGNYLIPGPYSKNESNVIYTAEVVASSIRNLFHISFSQMKTLVISATKLIGIAVSNYLIPPPKKTALFF